MPVLSRYRLRHLRRLAFYALAAVLVAVAVLVGSISQLLPLAERHPGKVAAWLSERAGQPVAFDRLETRWTRRGPLLRLEGLRIGQGEGVRIGQAEVLLSLYAGLLPGAPMSELRLRGLALTLQRADDGRWSVRGLPSTGSAGDPLDALRRLGELQVIGGRLRVDAPSLGLDAELPRIDLRLRVDGGRLRAGVRGWIDTGAAPVTAVLDFQRRQGDGVAWIAAAPADLSAWATLLRFDGVTLHEGSGTLNGWVTLRDHRVAAVVADAELTQVALQGAPFAAAGRPPDTRFDSLRLRARWRQEGGDWRLDAPLLRVASGPDAQVLDGLHLRGGSRFALRGRRIDATPLLRVAALSGAVPVALRQWLYAAAPTLRFTDVDIAGETGGAMRGAGELEEAAFAAVGDSPGLSGLSGRFEGDGEALALQLRPRDGLRFDWPTGFGVVHALRLDGQAVVWREGAGWHVATPAMRVQGPDYAAIVRGGMWFQGDGTRPWISLAAELDDVPMTAAKGFWVRSHMSQAAVGWLDAALVDGHVRGGVGLAVGDLDDWPFDGHDGRFEARGRIDGGTVHFSDDWPDMLGVEADIAFIANGFQMQGKGELGGVGVDSFRAGIADYGASQLKVEARTVEDSSRLLALLRRSPLQAEHGDTLDALSASGPAAVDFGLALPLHEGGEGRVQGAVELRGARLADRRWDLRFDNVRGRADYGSDGFHAPALQVDYKTHEGVLSLAAGAPVADPRHAFEAALTASLDADDLLQRAPELQWLQPYVHGTSRWSIGVALPVVPEGGRSEPPTTLSLHSDLRGTRLQLPAPLDKPAAEALPTRVTASLPLGSGGTEVAFGRRLALSARAIGAGTGVQVTLGSDRVSREPSATGLVVDGHTGTLDALEWIGLARGQGGTDEAPGEGLALRQVNVLARELLLAGGRFEQTRLRLRPDNGAVAVQLDGPALAGALRVPDATGATVSGTLARVHWQMAPAVPGEAGDRPADPLDPARIPPLSLDIGELVFGKAALGRTTLRTRPLADGLEVTQLQLRSPKQAIDVSGQWRGSGAQARTRVDAEVRSDNLGGLLDNLGYGGQLRGGQGQLHFSAGWAGAPSAFDLAGLEGSLVMDARNGQILEVEPGAGRVLGLLSVAQLPRRMMLDFRDFFSKGLAFNHAQGRVEFGDGVARTSGIGLQGPAADIAIRGQADLRAHRFDQTIEVNPRSGNLLTVVGAVAGGPMGAAVGAAANAVLGKPLGEIGARTYRVTGPWSDPRVDVIDRDAAPRVPAPLPAPAPATADEAGTP
ncbi:YhdP family protein [Stenotrophomonas mori]|uniref:TIGR02099 family protein n=1 Tax=Stenotrophomonas mori TaxID=2871096 RepID=A0ABT0SE03_9GAMM|nr:YhdP family protein [Stenotrophomonas mori]MCL7713532.1 TIGR02099 family protein [Stenotrophomonas mori]